MADITTVRLPERVDSETSAAVEASLVAALRPGARVVVDGSPVTYMSAAGVRVLAIALHHAAEVEARIVFCSFSGAAADCLLVSGFAQLFDVAESVAEAEQRLSGRPVDQPVRRLHARGGAG
ncbi:MAG: STAS domain-containing protein [Reyranella sp.]|uniref:STAS domain-containing protein n=1 Tax=Reyranella sp. TaxID=1929291 RepID=UPI003D12FABB